MGGGPTVDFTGLRVGEKSEADFLAGKSPDQRAEWEGDKHAFEEHLHERIDYETKHTALRVGVASAAFVLHPVVRFVEPGWYGGIVSKEARVEMTLRVTGADGKTIDEVELRPDPTSAGATVRGRLERLGGSCRHRRRRVPLSAASPVPRDPPAGGETALRLSRRGARREVALGVGAAGWGSLPSCSRPQRRWSPRAQASRPPIPLPLPERRPVSAPALLRIVRFVARYCGFSVERLLHDFPTFGEWASLSSRVCGYFDTFEASMRIALSTLLRLW